MVTLLQASFAGRQTSGTILSGMKWREIPFRLKVVFSFAALLFYGSILLLILLWPLIFLYGWLLCVIAWIVLPRMGKDILVVRDGSERSAIWMSEIEPLVSDGALYLNYDERKTWRYWSLPVQLFYQFGPRPMPEFVTPRFLPAVIVFTKFHRPKRFTFGDRSRDPKQALEELRMLVANGSRDG